MLGFVNGLAIVIFLGAAGPVQGAGSDGGGRSRLAGGDWMTGVPLAMMLGLWR
jgi:SulP family sulfate permease